MINSINRTRACHILTIEDPIEFVHEPLRSQITHREVGRTLPRSRMRFARGSRKSRRDLDRRAAHQRDHAAGAAAGELCVLVFGTVHTNSAPATIERIINAFPHDEQPQIRGMLAESWWASWRSSWSKRPTARGAWQRWRSCSARTRWPR
jgi:twitching motility protein PilT